jgi:hypothetical protein
LFFFLFFFSSFFFDVMQSYWKAHENDYPHLSKLAMRYLGIPASGVFSEELWSLAALIDAPRRGASTIHTFV